MPGWPATYTVAGGPSLAWAGLRADKAHLAHQRRGDHSIPLARHHELSLQIIDNSPFPGFGLEEGRHWSALDFGMVGFTAFSSANLGEAIKCYCQFQLPLQFRQQSRGD